MAVLDEVEYICLVALSNPPQALVPYQVHCILYYTETQTLCLYTLLLPLSQFYLLISTRYTITATCKVRTVLHPRLLILIIDSLHRHPSDPRPNVTIHFYLISTWYTTTAACKDVPFYTHDLLIVDFFQGPVAPVAQRYLVTSDTLGREFDPVKRDFSH